MNEYMHVTFPRLIVRFEDLIFFAKCVRGEMKEQDFVYICSRQVRKKELELMGPRANENRSSMPWSVTERTQVG